MNQFQQIEDALVLAEDVLSRYPASTQLWMTESGTVHPQEGITLIRDAIEAIKAINPSAEGGESSNTTTQDESVTTIDVTCSECGEVHRLRFPPGSIYTLKSMTCSKGHITPYPAVGSEL